jgi:hydrogenase maturation protease
MNRPTPLLILGLGNVLLGDDGLGPAAVARLHDQYRLPPDVRVLDGGTLGLALLPYVEDADAVILVDAVRGEGPPGTFVRLAGDDVGPAVATRLSPHQIGVSDVLDGARWLDRYPPHVVLLGLVPESIELGVGLSEPVATALPEFITHLVHEASTFGCVLRRRSDATSIGERPIDLGRLVAASEGADA